MTTTITARDILSRAAEFITENGWHQGYYISDEGRCVCALGAINAAAVECIGREATRSEIQSPDLPMNVSAVHQAAEMALAALVEDVYPDGVAYWNDDDDRTQEEVVAMLRRAAEGGELK
jgi:hypothetical protein